MAIKPKSWILVLLVLVLAACADEAPQETPPADAPAQEERPASQRIEGVGFATPESVLHDPAGDVYLVSNINGDPLEQDGNGFISRLSPEGEVLELRWIDGAAEGVTLHAPKGMAVVENRLYVSDIDVVRVFDRETGEPMDEHPVEGASFLNDVAAGPDGTVYVSDTGLGPGFEPAGTDAVYALRNGEWDELASGPELSNPNGLVVAEDALLMVPFGGATVFRIPADAGPPSEMVTLPSGQLDGVVRLDDGTLLVSSWEGEAVLRIGPGGEVDTVAEGLQAPADIGWDARRGRLLIPLFMDDRVETRALR